MNHHLPARVLVTGGAGFIGSHLVERLLARGDRVTVLDDLRNSRAENLAGVQDQIDFVTGDCTRVAEILGADNFTFVYHLGAPAYVPPSVEDPIADLRANVEQTLHVLNAMRNLERPPRLVHVSSAAVYGAPNVQPIREECPPSPVSPYGVDKFAAEEHVRVACMLHNLRASVLRYFPVYGPRQRKQVVFDVANKIIANRDRIEVFGTGQELRDLVFVDDVVSATIIAAERAPAHGEAYNVGSGTMVTIHAVVEAVARALGATPEIVFSGDVRPGDSRRMVADIGRLRNLGYEPETTLDRGIARTVAWITGAQPPAHGAVA
ncbi:MAG TPA: NAD-dependent epimerase/dehydratase family protein [Actinomycetota bacterium]|nr:NAD-dependent epimerase/dehydratase family protein [Actinomycetota bacterium]